MAEEWDGDEEKEEEDKVKQTPRTSCFLNIFRLIGGGVTRSLSRSQPGGEGETEESCATW